MILALDVGNTNIVVGCLDGEDIYLECRLSSDRNKTEAEYAVIFKNLLDVYDVDLSKIDGAIISSVVPPITNTLKNAVFTVTGYEPVEVNVKMNHGLKFVMDNPEVGNDLTVVAVAALDKFKAPLIIFDLGTATTISVIDKDGIFRGVSIFPGVKTAMNALFDNAAQLTAVKIEAPPSAIGTNTVESLQSGAVFGNAAMMDGMIDRIEKELGYKTTVVATGGLAKFLTPHCSHDIYCDDSMLLRGLQILYNKNK
ncbi:MAG: type III pantothenate kinase [Clostridia bacterium]|nr:type III pantothenate kinase [Clostridia bacterium]